MAQQRRWTLGELTPANQTAVRALILAGLEERWGWLDPTMNPDLDDMISTYRDAQTVVAHVDGVVVGTGTLKPVSYTHLRAHETLRYLVCRLLLEKKKKTP